MTIETSGKVIDKIPVEISYRIINLFSAGLYSSPNKAFEELVSNSYDAYADEVSVFVPSDTSASDAYIWVCDNGISMDTEGLKLLWKIGVSQKRNSEDPDGRLQIGKFGIGKLATYVLARKLTYICKNDGNRYLAVTMDYSDIDQSNTKENVVLNERELTLQEVKDILKKYITIDGRSLLSFNLWGDDAEDTWTFCIMTDLKPKAGEISEGMLKWVLRTALPLNPNFNLYYNGSKLLPSKVDQDPIKKWVIGKDDKTAENHFEVSRNDNNDPVVNLEHLKNIRGEIYLYEGSLVKGKSEKWGRSNGIFLMVRGRLVNMSDPLLGMDAFSHGTFNRTRMIIHADELDENLTSTRESIKESKPLKQLREYIKKKFVNEVKPFWVKWKKEEDEKHRASSKLFKSSGSLSRRPLLAMMRRYFNGEITHLMYTNVPQGLSEERKQQILGSLEEDLTSETGIIKDVVDWEIMEPDDPIAKFDLESGKAKINLLHPFFANFSDEIKTTLPFELIALTEILTEAYLIEIGISEKESNLVLKRRDQLLREFTFSDRPNAPGVATMLRDSLADATGLEDAVFHAFNNLGFDTTKLGGPGKPDGRAVARLGFRSEGESANYSIVYDAKSTGKEKIKAATAKISTSKRHRTDYDAEYSAVIARDFEGADDADSAVNKEAKQNGVTLITAKDFIKLLLLSAPKQIGLSDIRALFESCNTVTETSEWINKISDREPRKGPIKELLETTFELLNDTEPPVVSTVRLMMKQRYEHLSNISNDDVRTLVESLERLVPGYISLEHELDIISLQAKPEKILDSINSVTAHDIAPEFKELYMSAFENL
jgi:hypothetical protein